MKKTLASIITLLFISSAAWSQSKLEKDFGKQAFDMVVKTQGLYKNDNALAMVMDVGRALEKQLTLGYPLHYYLVDTTEPNAFATAGGYVFVTRGLLAIINSKDELAGILAHELSHVTQHHATKKIAPSIFPAILELPGKLIGALTHSDLASVINVPIEATSKVAMASYSRSQERDADKLGVDLAANAGFNPYGLVVGLERLTAYVEFEMGKTMKKTLLTDHPITPERTAYLTQLLEQKGLQRSAFPAGTDLRALEGLIYGQNPGEGLFRGTTFVHPQIGLYCEFPSSWKVQNSPVSLTAVDSLRKSTLLVSVDSTKGTAKDAAQKMLKALKQNTILSQQPITIHGNEAYRATVGNPSVASSPKIEIMWLKLPSNVMLEVVGTSSIDYGMEEITTCMNSFRTATDADLKNFSYREITLKDVHTAADVEAAIGAGGEDDKAKQLLRILNGIPTDGQVPAGRYLKVMKNIPLKR